VPLSHSTHSLSSSSSYSGGTGGSRGGGASQHPSHHGPSAAATPGSFAAWSTQRPPKVITLDDAKAKDQQNDLGDFLTQLQNVKDDALSSQS
jgi:hypothetical protein